MDESGLQREPSLGQAGRTDDWFPGHERSHRRHRSAQQQLRSEDSWIKTPGAPNLLPADSTTTETVLRISNSGSNAFCKGWMANYYQQIWGVQVAGPWEAYKASSFRTFKRRASVRLLDVRVPSIYGPSADWITARDLFMGAAPIYHTPPHSDVGDGQTLTAAMTPDRKLRLAISESRRMLAFEDNWDDQGSPGYLEDTWDRATDFLQRLASAARERFSTVIPVPTIGPAEAGSIDLYWEMDGADLLINFPQDPGEPAAFYGERGEQGMLSGTVPRGSVRSELILWLLDQE